MKIKANGILMNYELTGSGDCLTLIHGGGENLNSWFQQVPVFSQRYRVLTYDVRGQGQTELSDAEYSIDLWAQDLEALLDALSLRQSILLGHSLGGAIALKFTLNHPDRVRALILANSAGVLGRRQTMTEVEREDARKRWQAQVEAIEREGLAGIVEERIQRMFSPGFPEQHPELMQRYRAILLQNDPRGYLRLTGRALRWSEPPDFSKVSCPTLIIAGEFDHAMSVESAQEVNQAIARSQLRVLATGHAAAIEQPEMFNAAVLGFLSTAGL